MEKFTNITNDGNEKAIRKGKTVPPGDVNLAYFKSPGLSPSKNVVIIDTSQTIEENASAQETKVFYANNIGILEDIYGNQLIQERYPIVSDVFSVNEDYSLEPNTTEYSSDTVLAFLHTSRHFHIDYAGMTPGTDSRPYYGEHIKVVDQAGRNYANLEGKPRYKIFISPATSTYQATWPNHWAYRVFVYVDDYSNEDLYFVYNKIEIDLQGNYTGQHIAFKERLNPQPYFSYDPEESAVVDPDNRLKRIYSTQPFGLKEQVLDMPYPSKNGFRIFVPKKAVSDPRIFQLFRWRLNCKFKKTYTVDPTKQNNFVVKVGVVTTGKGSRSPYAFYNLERSNYNVNNLRFINPIKHGRHPKKEALYWTVDFNKVTNAQLEMFDILLWSPGTVDIDMKPYMAKIKYFVEDLGRTLMFDTNSYTKPDNSWPFAAAAHPVTGAYRSEGTKKKVTYESLFVPSKTYVDKRGVTKNIPLIEGDVELGGWKLSDNPRTDQFLSITYYRFFNAIARPADQRNRGKSQCFNYKPSGFIDILNGYTPSPTGNSYVLPIGATPNPAMEVQEKSTLIWRPTSSNGNYIITTLGIAISCSMLVNNRTNLIKSYNLGDTRENISNYDTYIHSDATEGSYKFLYNAVLLSTQKKVLNSSEAQDEQQYSSEWTYSTPWKSSWTINAANGVLTQAEIDKYGFVFREKNVAEPYLVWQRKLSFKTAKELINEILDDEMLRNVQGASREYEIETTNSIFNGGAVEVPTVVYDNSYVYAWTEAFSPKFIVPLEIGPHIVKEDKVTAEFGSQQAVFKSYPPRPYRLRVKASSVLTTDKFEETEIAWTARGTAIEHYTDPDPDGNRTEIRRIPWNVNTYDDGSGNPYKGVQIPTGLTFGQEHNYYSTSRGAPAQNWVHWGLINRYGVNDNFGYGSSVNETDNKESGEVVKFIQDALNKFQFFNLITLPNRAYLKVDGLFGGKTESAVRSFQTQMNARYVDGIVDAETFSLIGGQILRIHELITWSSSDFTRYYGWAVDRMPKKNISDLNNSYERSFAKRSWFTGGPPYISETFFVKFNKQYKIVGTEFVPFAERANSIILESLDVRRGMTEEQIRNYDPAQALIKGPWNVLDGKKVESPLGPINGDMIIITLGQNKASFANVKDGNTARMIGIRDFYALAEVNVGEEDDDSDLVKATREVSITQSGTITLTKEGMKTYKVRLTNDDRDLSNIRWNSVSFSTNGTGITAEIDSTGLITFYAEGVTHAIENTSAQQVVLGPIVGDQTSTDTRFYSMNTSKSVNRMPENGWISRDEGIKLLCKAPGDNPNVAPAPFGFDASNGTGPLMPTLANARSRQRHFVSIRLETLLLDPEVRAGFYDINKKEFVTNANGEPEMSYIEYMTRGPNNIYIGVYSTLEEATLKPITDDDAPIVPHLMAMPAYGVTTLSNSKIHVEPMPKHLDEQDMWPLGITVGSFDRKVFIREQSAGGITGYLNRYQGTTVHAFYGVPEASLGGWSLLYGPPNVDVKGERPILLDEYTIQVKQPPIHMQKEPTQWMLESDPVRPIIKLYRRDVQSDPWTRIPLTDIKDFNASTGEVFLETPLDSLNPDLIKVDYVSARKVYEFKGFDEDLLNLNPYHGMSQNLIGKAIYVYILPKYVRDEHEQLIEESVNERTIRFTTNSNIFDSLSEAYDPLAIQLAIVYISTVADINDLTILDSRHRGGGALDELSIDEIGRITAEAIYNWDINYGSGASYQKGGFIILRFPEEVKDYFSEDELRKVINRNVPIGVAYQIEDLSGNPWS